MSLNYNEVVEFIKEFKIDFLNRYNELIIDEDSNTYVNIETCNDIDDVKTRVVFALCRPISKGLEIKRAIVLLERFNKYFNTNLTREDMRLMYEKLCYVDKLEQFKEFIKRGFPVSELRES